MTYRSRYYTTLQPAAVLEVLMKDGSNPRSLDFQVNHVADLYSKLPRNAPADLQSMENAVHLLRGFDLHTLDYSLPGAANDGFKSSERSRLNRALTELETFLASWSNNLSNTYFNHARTLPVTIGE